jgi:hypothetical protein
MSSFQLVDAPPIDPKTLPHLRCADEIVGIDHATHAPTVIRGCDIEALTTLVFTM